MPVWVRMPDLPIEFWSDDSISRGASTLGRPLFIDGPTSRRERASFARICVEMEVGAEFSDTAVFVYGDEGEFTYSQPVVYEWRPRQCPKCKVFDHEEGKCIPSRAAQPRPSYVPKGQQGPGKVAASSQPSTAAPAPLPSGGHREDRSVPPSAMLRALRAAADSASANSFGVLGAVGEVAPTVLASRPGPALRPRAGVGGGVKRADKGKGVALQGDVSEIDTYGYPDDAALKDLEGDFQLVGRKGRLPRGYGGTKLKGQNKGIRIRSD